MRTFPVEDMLGQTVEPGDLVTWGIKGELTVGKAEFKLFERYVDSTGQERMLKTDDPAVATHCKFTIRRIFNLGLVNAKNIKTGEHGWYNLLGNPADWVAERASSLQPGTNFLKLTDDYTDLLRGKAAV